MILFFFFKFQFILSAEIKLRVQWGTLLRVSRALYALCVRCIYQVIEVYIDVRARGIEWMFELAGYLDLFYARV